MNGIEAARRIRNLSPLSKVVFVSQQSSPDVVTEALRTGASGYVIKMDAGRELLSALAAVLRGEQFLSSTIAIHDFGGRTNLEMAETGSLFLKPAKATVAHRHEAAFYSDDQHFIDGFTNFIVPALKAGAAVIALTTESHRNRILAQLRAQGDDVSTAVEQGRCISLDVAEALSTFMLDGLPDRLEFLRITGDLIVKAKALKFENAKVVACGECAPVLWTQANPEAAIELEKLWNEIANLYDLDILCGYSLPSLQRKKESQVFAKICAEHSVAYSV